MTSITTTVYVPKSQVDPSSTDQTLVPIQKTVEVPDSSPRGLQARELRGSGNAAKLTGFDRSPVDSGNGIRGATAATLGARMASTRAAMATSFVPGDDGDATSSVDGPGAMNSAAGPRLMTAPQGSAANVNATSGTNVPPPTTNGVSSQVASRYAAFALR